MNFLKQPKQPGCIKTTWIYRPVISQCQSLKSCKWERIKDITSFKYSYLIDCLDCKTFFAWKSDDVFIDFKGAVSTRCCSWSSGVNLQRCSGLLSFMRTLSNAAVEMQ